MRIKASIAAAAALLALAWPMVATAQDDVMTREKYDTYLQRFNAGDDRYAELYQDDVVFDHGPYYGILDGKQAIIDFYQDIRTKLKETVTVQTLVIDNEHNLMAAEITTDLLALRDGVELPSGTLGKGERFVTKGTVYYGLENGRIATIRGSARGVERIPPAE